MKNKVLPFKIFLEYDPEYKGYIADCVSLHGCMSQGKTEDEALKNIAEAIKGYLQSLRTQAELKEKKQILSNEIRFINVGV